MKKAEFFERVAKIDGIHRLEEDKFIYCEEVKHLRVHFLLKLSETPRIVFGTIYTFPLIYSEKNVTFIEAGWVALKMRVHRAYDLFCREVEKDGLSFTQESFDEYVERMWWF